jgi:methionyl-tRNA synthetase
MLSEITLDQFAQLDIQIGTVIAAYAIADTDTLLRLDVDIGTEVRQIVTGMAKYYDPSFFLGKQVPILVNLAPQTIRGVESQGMLLATDDDGRPILLHPDALVADGSRVR